MNSIYVSFNSSTSSFPSSLHSVKSEDNEGAFLAKKSNQTMPTEIRSVVGEVYAVTFVNDARVPRLTLESAADSSQESETDSEDRFTVPPFLNFNYYISS